MILFYWVSIILLHTRKSKINFLHLLCFLSEISFVEITIILRQVLVRCSGTQFMLNAGVESLDHTILIILDEALWCFVYISARAPFNLLSTLFLTCQSFGNNTDSVTIIRCCLTSFKSMIENHQFLREQPQHQLISSCVSCVVPVTRIISNIVAGKLTIQKCFLTCKKYNHLE